MADSLTLAQLLSRIESMTLSGSVNFGHWSDSRKIDLVNEAILEVYKSIIESFEEAYFCDFHELTATNNQVSIAALPKPCYAVVAFQRQFGSSWLNVEMLTVADVGTVRNLSTDTWYRVGDVFKSDRPTTSSDRFRIIYHYYPRTLAISGDVCDIPTEYVDMVVTYAAAQACLQAMKNDSYAHLMADYNRRLELLKRTANARTRSRTRRVVDKLGYRPGGRVFLFDNRVT